MAIRIDNSDAKAKFTETKEQASALREEMLRLEKEGKKNTDEYKHLQEQYDKLNKSIAEQRKVVGLCGLSYAELRKGAKALKREMDNATPGTEKWERARADYLLTKKRMKELEVQARETRFSLSKMADGFNRYAALGAGAIASLTGIALTARKCVDEFAEMEEAEAQVIKYTGMTKEEVRELNEEFKKMDTRTPREKLNALAGDAGRLGITGKKEVKEFVEAANMINVALGEDLGEDAEKNIGKLAQMFGEDDKLGLRGAMLATGSAINEVAQNSSAAEAYLVAFTARVAGAANQANVAQGDIIGYASVLDQNMQQQEMAATAFQNLMMKMYQEPAKFAKIAGKNVEEFSALIKKDANEAILQLLDTLNKKGGLDKLAPMFKEMGLDGVRASGVISTMAGKIDDIRKAQKLANDAYRDGTSVVKEYNVQNNTVQAQLDKAKKRFKDVRIELGEKLQPVMKYMLTTGSLTVKALSAIVSILFEYKGAVAGAMVVTTAWIATKKAHVAWTKLEVLWTNRAILSMKSLKKVMASNIYGIILVGLGAFVGKMIEAHNKQDDLRKSLTGMKKINHEVAQSFSEQEDKIRALTSIIKDNGVSIDERRKALDELKSIIPGYNGLISDEGTLTDDNTEAIKRYLVQLEKEIKLKAAKQELEELYAKKRGLESDERNQSDKYWDIRSQNTLSGYNRNGFAAKVSRFFGTEDENNALKDLNETRDALKDVAAKIEEINKEIAQTSVELKEINNEANGDNNGNGNGNGNGGGGNGGVQDVKDIVKAREELLKRAMQEERNIWKEEYLNKQHTEEEYNQALYDSEITFLLKKKALLERYKQDTTEIQGQIYDKMIAEANRLESARKKEEKADDKSSAKEKKEAYSLLDMSYRADQQSIKKAYLDGDIRTEEEYRDKLLEAERDYLEKKRAMQMQYGDDTTDADGKLLDARMTEKKESREKAKKEGFDAMDRSKYVSDKLNILDAMYNADLISYEEYQKKKTELTEAQEKEREQKTLATFDAIGQAAQAASQLISALQDSEISKITRKYDKEIAAAKKAGKDTTKLEEEKEEAINEVKKKYADKHFAAAVLQVTAATSVAAMEAYKAMAGIPIVGPALGAVAAAAAIASGAAQIAVAKQQRDEAKGLKTGGYSAEYVEGYTRTGNPDDVAGVIPVHKNEFVTNHEGVANPHVRQFLDVFDVAQKNGTIRMLNTTQILEQVKTRSGKYSGGYADDFDSSTVNLSRQMDSQALSPEVRKQVISLLQENNRLLGVLCEKELIVDARKVRDAIKRVEQLEKNVSR